MMCTKCGKNPATVYYKSVINGSVTEQKLCAQCASELPVNPVFSDPFGDMFSFPVMPQLRISGEPCPLCGMTVSDAARTGKPGCPKCYSHFDRVFKPLIGKIHGRLAHTGDIPSSASEDIKKQHRLETLRGDLKNAVDAEEYERAAKIRDEIRKTEDK